MGSLSALFIVFVTALATAGCSNTSLTGDAAKASKGKDNGQGGHDAGDGSDASAAKGGQKGGGSGTTGGTAKGSTTGGTTKGGTTKGGSSAAGDDGGSSSNTPGTGSPSSTSGNDRVTFKPDVPLAPDDLTALHNCFNNLGADAAPLGTANVPVKVIGGGGGAVEMQQYEDLVTTSAPAMILVNIVSSKQGLAAHLALQNDNGFYCVHIKGGSQATVSLIEAACKAHIVSATVDSPNYAQGIVRTHGASAGSPGEPCVDASGVPVLPDLTQVLSHP